MAICVYHNPDFLQFYRRVGERLPDLRRLYLAAIVATADLETAYRLTQHVEGDWYAHALVTTVVHSRSTSIGDVLETADGRLWLVAPFGFTALPTASLPADDSALLHGLRSLVATELAQAEVMTRRVHHLYTALLFAAAVLEALADDVDRLDPHQALLARFAAEQARWALAQADGGQ